MGSQPSCPLLPKISTLPCPGFSDSSTATRPLRLLLDTHVVLAIIENRTATFVPGIQRLLADRAGEFHVSVASLWEIAIKWRLGKWQLTPDLDTLPELLRAIGIAVVPKGIYRIR
jgi:hypothetical protein